MISQLLRESIALLILSDSLSENNPAGADKLARAAASNGVTGGASSIPALSESFVKALRFEPVSGGSINSAYRIRSPQGQWFCKINSAARFPRLFEKEARGLELLASTSRSTASSDASDSSDSSVSSGALQSLSLPATAGLGSIGSSTPSLRIPRVLGQTTAGDDQVLILEWLDSEPSSNPSLAALGAGLALLHRHTRDRFGLEEDNYMGALPQSNTPHSGWTEFFITERLEPQLRLVADRSLIDTHTLRSFNAVYKALPGLFPPEPPALVHGDLWSGNVLYGSGGQPILIDPAVHYGHRSMDLAMTTLFGGFGKTFYESYNHHFPFPENYAEQWPVCNLYPLLIHLNLFGASYSGEILSTLRRFG